MRFGLFYEHQLPRPWADGDEEQLLLDALDQVELADRLGIDYVWEVEHHFLEEYSHSSAPEVFLAAVSQRTSSIRLGHGIVQLPPAINHPARVAERVATLDLLSGGRVDLGTGEGSSQVELGGFGVDRAAKREQWAESLDVVVRMLTEDPFTGHRGTWVDVPPRNVIPKPKQQPHPPLWLACSRRETIELAARRGLGALSFSFVDPEDAKPWVDAYYDILTSGACEPAGLAVNPNIAVTVPFLCHADEETALERGLDGAHFFGYSLGHYYVYGTHQPGATDIWSEFDRYRHERGFARDIVRAESEPLGMKVLQEGVGSLRGAVGTPDQVADLIARYEAVGVDQVILVAQAGRNRHEHVCESLELFAAEVLPRFAEGREEREVAKRERLAGALEQAAARRRRTPQPSGRYQVAPEGEPAPAITHAPVRRERRSFERSDLRDRAVGAVRGLFGAALGKVGDERLERVAANPWALKALFNGMARAVDPEMAEGLDATVQFELSNHAETHTWSLRVADGKAEALQGAVPDPAVILRAGLVDFLRMGSGEVSAGKAIMDERLVIDGDVGVAARLLRLLGGGQPY